MCDNALKCFKNILGLIWPLGFEQVSPWGASSPSLPKALGVWDRLAQSSLHGPHRKSWVPDFSIL